MNQQLVINTIGTYQPGLLPGLTRSILDNGGTISDCRMDLLGNEACISILVSGSWDAIAKIEGAIPKLGKELDVSLFTKRTGARVPDKQKLPYTIEIVCNNRPEIICKLTEYLTSNGIGICEFYTNTFQNPNTDITLLSIHMTVNIPADNSITLVRSEFLDFCDSLNLDAILEPVKGM